MNHEEWLAARRLGVSGTDIGVLLGVNPYKTADELVMDKLGVGKGFSGNAATRVGQRLEPFVANSWAKREQRILINGSFRQDDDNQRLIGTPDFLTHKSVLEIKTGAIKTWKYGCPKMYEYQLRWYMMLERKPEGELVACIVPKDRAQVPMHEDDDYLAEWISYQPHQEYHFDRNPEWESQARLAAHQFLERLDRLKSDGQSYLRGRGWLGASSSL